MEASRNCDTGLALRRGGPRPAVRALLDAHFDDEPGVLEEFPLLLGPGSEARSWVFETHGDEPPGCVAHAAWRPLELVCGSERLRAAGIGLVTTHADWRGHGLATALVAHCAAHAYREGPVLALLFAPERTLYARLGFVPAGRERITELPRAAATARHGAARPGPESERVRAAGARDVPALHALLAAQPWRVERSAQEFAALLAIPGTHAYVLERGGSAVAYCCSGKGRDLRGIIHEWAGEPAALGALIAAVVRLDPETRWLLSPAGAVPPVAGPEQIQSLLLARVLRPEAVGTDDAAALLGAGARRGRLESYVWGLDSF